MAQYGITLVTAPTLEPITSAEARLQCGIADDAAGYHDPNLIGLIQAAREKVETDTSRAIMAQTWDYTFDLWPRGLEAIHIPKSPVSSITSVKYYDQAGAQQTLSTSVYDGVRFLNREPGEIRLKYQQQWPFLYGERGAITVRFVAGYGATANLVPESLKSAMLLLVSDWFTNSDGERPTSTTPRAYDALINKFTVGDEFHTYSRSLCV